MSVARSPYASAPAKGGVEVFAPAKVNLYLHVTGKRPDGYHLLDSLVVFAGVGDTVIADPADDLTLAIDGPTAGALLVEPDNIILKAARALSQAAGVAPRAALSLTKRLPVASGIGGGSADGAAALRALCALWRLHPSEADLAEIGLTLGADLPVCLHGRPTHMAGIGERLTAAPTLPPAWLVLVNPRVAVHTPAVFKARRGEFSPAAPLTEAPADADTLADALRLRHNDLAEPALSLEPVIGTVLGAIAATPQCLLPRMSGSGATCFGLYADQASAQAAVAQLEQNHPSWWIAAAPLVSRE